jgi:hypothetical protein
MIRSAIPDFHLCAADAPHRLGVVDVELLPPRFNNI